MSEIHLIPGKACVTETEHDGTYEGVIENFILGFYEQDSFIMPAKIQHCSAELIPGYVNTWLEYVPDNYTGEKAVPLVIAQHGGGQTGWRHAHGTSWFMAAEQYGFIVVYPDEPDNITGPGDKSKKSQAMTNLWFEKNNLMISNLIENIAGRYSVDRSRIFMQGMSKGEMKTSHYIRSCGMVAAAGEDAGPATIEELFTDDGELIDNPMPTAIYQSRGTLDPTVKNPAHTRMQVNTANRDYWKTINGCQNLPLIKVGPTECVAYWRGSAADVVYRDVFMRRHGQTIDSAQRAWDLLFSHVYRRDDGTLDCGEVPDFADKNAVALVEGAAYAYIDNKKVPIGGKVTIEHAIAYEHEERIPKYDYMRVPVVFLKNLGFDVDATERSAILSRAGDTIEIADGNTAAIVNGKIERMYRYAEERDGLMYVDILWIAERFLNKHVTQLNGAMYMSDKPCRLTPDFAEIIREILE